jgi:hypothetical protein
MNATRPWDIFMPHDGAEMIGNNPVEDQESARQPEPQKGKTGNKQHQEA